MLLAEITPLVLTYNEAANIRGTLGGLSWAAQIVLIDSYSNDETKDLASRFSNVRIINRQFDNHTAQWNFGLDQVETEWVLTLDADYHCPAELVMELQALPSDNAVYFAGFRYCVLEKVLRGTLYPPRAVLFKPRRFRYASDGHTQRLDIQNEPPRRLMTRLLHDDRKPLSTWLSAQIRYAELESAKLSDARSGHLGWKDRLRRWYFVAPLLTFIYCLFVKRLILDGRAGCYYTMQRVYAELLLGMTLLDRRLRNRAIKNSSQSIESVAADQPGDSMQVQ